MDHYFQIVAAVLLSVILVIILKNSTSGLGELLTLAICAMVMFAAVQQLKPIIALIQTIQGFDSIDTNLVKTLIKAVGISLTAEIAEILCDDAGSRAMGKALQYLSTAVIACLMIPMINALLELIEGVLATL